MTRALVVIADAEPEWTSDGQPVAGALLAAPGALLVVAAALGEAMERRR